MSSPSASPVHDESTAALFGGDAPPAVRALIERAKGAPREHAAALLNEARALSPSALPVYYLLYKLHATRGELTLAYEAACAGLAEAGRKAGLPLEFRDVSLDAPTRADFVHDEAARFWLFTLKALAFLSLRLERPDDAALLLQLIGAHDPSHSVGSDVTLALLAGAR